MATGGIAGKGSMQGALKFPAGSAKPSTKIISPSAAPENRDELIQKIEEELTCAICLGKFDDPKILPCLHTYCRKCIETLVGKSQQKDAVVCPQCRGVHTLPVGGACKLLTSFTFTNLVKLLEVHKADGKVLTCQNGLDDDPAVARCVECDAYLCSTCRQMHKKMIATRNHEIISLEEIKATGEKCFQTFHYCPDHKKEVLKLYCRTCSKTICGDCTYVDHRSHEYVFIKDIQEELRGTLSKKLDTMKKVSSELKSEKEKADEAMEKHETNVTNIHSEVDKRFEELIQVLKDRQARIHREIDVDAKKAEKPIATNIEEVDSTLAHLMSNISFMERLLKSNDACELATMANPTLEQCNKLEAGRRREKVAVCSWKLEGVEKSKKSIQTISARQAVVATAKTRVASSRDYPTARTSGAVGATAESRSASSRGHTATTRTSAAVGATAMGRPCQPIGSSSSKYYPTAGTRQKQWIEELSDTESD